MSTPILAVRNLGKRFGSLAFAVLPQLWQMLLGAVLLATILFLPQGLGSLATRLRRPAGGPKAPEGTGTA